MNTTLQLKLCNSLGLPFTKMYLIVAVPSCYEGFTRLAGFSCVIILESAGNVDWYTARDLCLSRGADLLTLDSLAKHNAVYTFGMYFLSMIAFIRHCSQVLSASAAISHRVRHNAYVILKCQIIY